MAQTAPARRPFPLPSDIGADAGRSVSRAATAAILTAIVSPNERPEKIIEKAWPGDSRALGLLTRAASSPATTTTAGWAAELAPVSMAAAFLSSLVQSAASRLFSAGLSLSLEGVAAVKIPYAAATPSLAPSLVAEGAPIPTRQAGIATVTLGPVRKLATLAALSNELAGYSTPVAEQVVRQVMLEAASRAVDQAVFTTSAGGILNGVAPLTATAGGGAAAFVGDIKLLLDALAAAGAGSRVMLFAAPSVAARIAVYAPAYVATVEIIATPSLGSTVVAVDPGGFISGTTGQPRIDVGKSTAIHYEDTAPLQISSGAQGSAVLATPVRSAFQHDSYVLRLIVDLAYVCRPGWLAFVPNVTW